MGHSDLTLRNDFSVCRSSRGISESSVSETENKTHEHLPPEGRMESTTLQIRAATQSQDREPCLALAQRGAPLAEDRGSSPTSAGSKHEETRLSYPGAPHTPDTPRACSAEGVALREKADAGWPGPVVELQLSLSQDVHPSTGAPVVALLGAEKPKCPDPDPHLHHSGTVHVNSVPTSEKGAPSLRSSKIIQICSGRELRVIQGQEAGDAGLARVGVILGCSDRLQGGCRLQAGRADSLGEGGHSEAPPSLVAFAVSSEGTEQGEDPRCERDHSRPHKHRARHARESGWGWRGAGGCGHCAEAWPAWMAFSFKDFFFLLSLIGLKKREINAQNKKMKLGTIPVSELEAVSLNFVAEVSVLNARSFTPKGTGTVKDDSVKGAFLICLRVLS